MSSYLPEPGIDDFLPILIDTILDHPALENWQFDNTIFWLILLALVVCKGGVIVDLARSKSQRQLLQNVVNTVRGIAESIFGLDTHCIHLDGSVQPEELRGIILDRRKRTLRTILQGEGQNALSHSQSTPLPATAPTSLSGLTTRYHSAESILPTSSTLSSPAMSSAANGMAVEAEWPEVLIVSGLEDCDSPTQNKAWELVKLSGKERANGREMLLVWIRREEKGPSTPAWLADHFVLSGDLYADDMEPPPRLHRQALIPSSYIENLASLLPFTHIHPTLTQQLNNLISAASAHPNLQSVLTGRFLTSLPRLVQASRLLTGGFTLPPNWQENLARLSRPDQGDTHRFGLGGGAGGVDGWARKAGQEPNLSELGEGGEGWFVELRDVKAIWRTIIRHRLKWRGLNDSVMWNLRTGAAGLVQAKTDSAAKQRRRVRKQLDEVDRILDEMIAML